MDIRRVALIFDDVRRPETTGVYCRRALESLVQVAFVPPDQAAELSPDDFDLFLNIDDGLRYRLPPKLRPCAWWCIDTHMDFAWCREKSRDFDLVFAAQRDGAQQLRREGLETARWLPLACDPGVHCRHEAEKRYDVCFIGNLVSGPRGELVELLYRRFANMFVGQAYFDEMARLYSASRIVFNRSIKNDVNMRVFEAAACGSLLLTNDLAENGQEELFQDGVHLAAYRDADELLDKVRFYLQRESLREQIAAAGRHEALARHTYQHRMREILQTAEKALSRTAPRGGAQAASCEASAAIQDARQGSDAEGAAAASCVNAAVDGSYFQFVRPELLALVPGSARRILELGCGAGRLGAALKARQACEVLGVELNPEAAALAQKRLDRVFVGDVEQMELDIAEQSLDVVICGDVLEHLHEPAGVLRRVRGWLRPGGKLVASIPNVAHRSVIANLLAGNWDYEPAGLLDSTHLRFFTRRSIERLLYRTRFSLRSMEVVGGAGYDEWWLQGKPGEVQIGPFAVRGLSSEEAEELHAYQYLLTAEADAAPSPSLTSIIIVTHNALSYTKRCLESVRAFTDEPYELIVVDNASDEETLAYLRAQADIRLVVNLENLGFPAAVNQGLELAKGEQILLLNPDVLATTGWLRRLLEAFDAEPDAGLVGPLTNCTAGVQRIPPGYDDPAEVDDFAWRWSQSHSGARIEATQLTGFCLLIRREVLQRVGPLDERFGLGLYEDVDYCVRAAQAGYRLLIACDSYVHHFGHRSYASAGFDQDSLLPQSERVFHEKWSRVDQESRTMERLETHHPEAAAASNFQSSGEEP